MFEYIKRVSIAIAYISQKIGNEKTSLKKKLEEISLELISCAQQFRDDNESVEDLQLLQNKIAYSIDLVDYARINNSVSAMNAKIFTDSMITFLKHVMNLIELKNSLSIPVYQLGELDEMLARKNAKAAAQNSQNYSDKFEFTNLPQPQKIVAPISVPVVEKNITEKIVPEKIIEAPKKILEESLIYPVGSLEQVEHDMNDRRERILKCLVNGGGSIKEISSKLKDISEKTIQRDLTELMRDKKVIMLGKKRWSKYYLK